MIKTYISPRIGDGLTPETAFRPYRGNFDISIMVVEELDGYFKWKTNVSQELHESIIQDNDIQEV